MNRKISKSRIHAYLDTDLIQGYLWGKPDEKKATRRTLLRLKSSRLLVKVPFVVVGELINNLIRADLESKDDLLKNFFSFIKEFGADLVPPSKFGYRICNELFEKDPLLKPVDALIVSQAFSDALSTRLLTTDKVLLNSLAIRDYEEGLRKDGRRRQKLTITEEF